ncbi:hypothetical protein JTE90_029005 [Oedothorax gibbosus]|uniref:Alcohol dehydrogenase-like N-terminal domain-containing protein n=1 Tax=Oedothorax gibbosus TaxID=931172 RepID=A0AAV6VH05_9ARAC|nr:hypothetical protein JTE90_029005 [Oedothorax gibbosus]
MQAIWVEKYGDHNVLQLKTVEKPTVTENQVLVQIASAGLNPVDTYIRSGNFIFKNEVPFTPGKDGAGIVREIGPKVKQFKVGQRVFVCMRHLNKYGTYAEYSLVNEEDTFPLPDCLSFDQGAALGIPYFTAHRALVHM